MHLAPYILALALATAPPSTRPPDNPEIDMAGHLRVSEAAARHRESRLVSEDEFIRMSREPGTIILDARSREMYDRRHVKGAMSLSFPDISVASLAQRIPDKNTRILIYCNNNFTNDELAFARKIATASLNLSTFITLYDYGYRNVWELGSRSAVEDSKLEFESSAPPQQAAAPETEEPNLPRR